jgi:hypothetical protein
MPRNNGRIAMETMPERINVIRTVTYSTESIIEEIRGLLDDPHHNPEIDEVLEFIEDWVEEDMRAPISRHDITYQDENGQEL